MRSHQLHSLRVITPIFVGAFVCTHAARAQGIESTLDLGGVAIQYADTVNATAASISPQVYIDWGSRILQAGGTYSQFGSDWSLQGEANGSVFAPVSRFVGELAGFIGGSTHRDGAHTGELLVNARLHAAHRRIEWFFGAGAGRTSFGGETRTLVLGEAGLSRSLSQGAVTLTATPVAMGDSIRYADGQAVLSLQRGRTDLSALLGARVGDQLTPLGRTARVWGNASVTSWLTSRAAIVLSGGTYPIDPTQGFPGGRFISLAIRLTHPRVSRLVRVDDSAMPGTVDAGVERFGIENNHGVVTFKVFAPSAHTVELTGDFTRWDPQAMTPVGNGWWVTTRALNPGKYQINLRVDGGKWIAPPGLLSMLDEFGGSVGLLVVESG